MAVLEKIVFTVYDLGIFAECIKQYKHNNVGFRVYSFTSLHL